jgi:hypothetical protein
MKNFIKVKLNAVNATKPMYFIFDGTTCLSNAKLKTVLQSIKGTNFNIVVSDTEHPKRKHLKDAKWCSSFEELVSSIMETPLVIHECIKLKLEEKHEICSIPKIGEQKLLQLGTDVCPTNNKEYTFFKYLPDIILELFKYHGFWAGKCVNGHFFVKGKVLVDVTPDKYILYKIEEVFETVDVFREIK